MKQGKSLLALLLALALCIALFPAAALAEDAEGAEEEEFGTIELIEAADPDAPAEDSFFDAEPVFRASTRIPGLPELPQALPPADEIESTMEGYCGSSMTWVLDLGTGILTITGSGDMYNYTASRPSPWFGYNSYIRTVKLPSGLTSIGDYAFAGCPMRTVTIPAKVTTIGAMAFMGCENLTTVEIPAGVKSLGPFSFYGCLNLTAINVASGNTAYSSSGGILYDKGKTVLLQCPPAKTGSVTIPSTVKILESVSFSDCSLLSSVKIPNGVTTIGELAFYHCDSLPYVTIPASVTEIGSLAFACCYDLYSIDVSSKNTAYTSLRGMLYDKDMTMLIQCPCATRTTVVRIPDTVTLICDDAFAYCRTITSVSIPAGVSSIGTDAFFSCTSLDAINVASGNRYYVSRDGVLYDKALTTLLRYPCAKAGTLNVPKGVARIESWAVSDTSGLTAVLLPDTLTSIGEGAFCWAEELREIWFLGESPDFDPNAFLEAYINAYYPAVLTQYWPTSVRQNYGGQVGWVPYFDHPDFNPFRDVKGGSYYYFPVLWAYYQDPQITGGISDTEFGPGQTCTREQIVTFLWKAMGAPEPASSVNPFQDVKSGKYYYKAVLWAVEKGITGGMDATHFGVGQPCTREQAMTFLWKAMDAPEPTTDDNPFLDVPTNKYYCKAVLWAVENGITSGVDAQHFGVGQPCTRGQIVTFLYKALVPPEKP